MRVCARNDAALIVENQAILDFVEFDKLTQGVVDALKVAPDNVFAHGQCNHAPKQSATFFGASEAGVLDLNRYQINRNQHDKNDQQGEGDGDLLSETYRKTVCFLLYLMVNGH